MKQFLQYQKAICKCEIGNLRVTFLENCKKADIIPKFLKFRIPNNGCFDEKSVHEFQVQLLKKEILKAKSERITLHEKLDDKRCCLKAIVPRKCLPSIVLHTRCARTKARRDQMLVHNKKLEHLSEEQERPLFNVENTVFVCGADLSIPKFVMETLSLGPKSAVLDKFDTKEILAEVDKLLAHCKDNDISDDIITDINVKTLTYIKKCKKFKGSRNVLLTKEISKGK